MNCIKMPKCRCNECKRCINRMKLRSKIAQKKCQEDTKNRLMNSAMKSNIRTEYAVVYDKKDNSFRGEADLTGKGKKDSKRIAKNSVDTLEAPAWVNSFGKVNRTKK